MPSKVTVELEVVNAFTPLQLPAILMVAAPEQVSVPTVKFPFISKVPVEIVIVPLFVALPVTFNVCVPIARVLVLLSVAAPVVPSKVPPLDNVNVA